MPKLVAELTLQLAPPLTSVGSVLLPVYMMLLLVFTMLLPIIPVVFSSETITTILGRGGAHVTQAIMSSSTPLGGRTSAIKPLKMPIRQ